MTEALDSMVALAVQSPADDGLSPVPSTHRRPPRQSLPSQSTSPSDVITSGLTWLGYSAQTAEVLARRRELQHSATDTPVSPRLPPGLGLEEASRNRQTDRSRAYLEQRAVRERAATAMTARTWWIWLFRFRLVAALRRARQRIDAATRSALASHPLCARFGAKLRSLVVSRAAALKLLSEPPRPMRRDVGYDSSTGTFTYRDWRGRVSTTHPCAAAGAVVPAYSENGSIVPPLMPPLSSNAVLCPEASGAWCYLDTVSGIACWFAPADAIPPEHRYLAPARMPSEPPPLLPQCMGLGDLGRSGWVPLFRDADHTVRLVCLQTGAIRAAPWIVLRTSAGCPYFANLVSRETRWLPPHGWMSGWQMRLPLDPPDQPWSAPPASYPLPLTTSRDCPQVGWLLERHAANTLPAQLSRERVEGGAPYLYEPSHGVPQYTRDDCDTPFTFPPHGCVQSVPRSSVPFEEMPCPSESLSATAPTVSSLCACASLPSMLSVPSMSTGSSPLTALSLSSSTTTSEPLAAASATRDDELLTACLRARTYLKRERATCLLQRAWRYSAYRRCDDIQRWSADATSGTALAVLSGRVGYDIDAMSPPFRFLLRPEVEYEYDDRYASQLSF